jgi:hypothetical protein
MQLTPSEAILIRNIVLIVAGVIVWGLSIFTAYRVAGTTGSILGFFFGPLGVIVAAAIGRDDRPQTDKQQVRAAEIAALQSSQSLGSSAALPPLDDAAALQRVMKMESADAIMSAVSTTSPQQDELLKRILIIQAAQLDYLKRINGVAQWFFWASIIGAALTIATAICANMY